MTLLITTAAVLIVATIVVALVTATELQQQRQELAALELAVLDLELELEAAVGQRMIAEGSLALHTKLRHEKVGKIAELNEELELLKEDRVPEREIKVARARRESSHLDEET